MTEEKYREFFKKELFPKKRILITDELLLNNGWDKYNYYDDYYFDNGDLGRISYNKMFGTYKLAIYYDEPKLTVKYIDDIKALVYVYVNSLQGEKYGYDEKAGGYKYLALDSDEERYDYRYKKYKKMMKTIKNKRV